MNRIEILRDDLALESPTLVEGMPGVGLVGKIATDHLITECEMVHYANLHSENLPPVAVYEGGDPDLSPPVRLYADTDRDLIALESDVPVTPAAALSFGEYLAEWYAEQDVTPIYLSGIRRSESEAVPSLYGVGTGGASDRLAEADLDAPAEAGLVSGPTGALLTHAIEEGYPALCLIVEADLRFPDPQAAGHILTDGIERLTGVDVNVTALTERAEEIRQAKQRFAERMQEADETSSQAHPLGMYQ
jgi:uncharacterized protein